MTTSEARHLVIDAMNVIGSRPNGWWRDRNGAVRTLVDRLARFAAGEHIAVTVVIDGRPLPDIPEGQRDGVEVLYANGRGRNAADDRIVE
jgi:predicted RNA-binding protein with PIN domain